LSVRALVLDQCRRVCPNRQRHIEGILHTERTEIDLATGVWRVGRLYVCVDDDIGHCLRRIFLEVAAIVR
jgi:hypothetical protein